jgi:outer membrane protein assembly factor BamC
MRGAGLRASVVSLMAMSLLSGCAVGESLNERSRIDYKSARTAPRVNLEVPPDLSSPRNDERFAVPGRAADATASTFQRDRAAAKPAGAAGTVAVNSNEPRLLPSVEGARIERAGGQRWLVVNQPADKIWPIVREFWQESGFVIQTERPEAGLLETDWAENRANIPQDFIRRTIGRVFDSAFSTSERDKFRTRLESGPNGTEIYISHRGVAEVLTGQFRESTKWEPRPSDPELEAEFLRRLLVKFGADQQRAAAIVGAPKAAGAAGAASASGAAPTVANAAALERAKLINDPANARVELVEGFDRAWRRVGLALDRGGFTVEDRDRSQGVYFVRYIDPEIDSRNSGGPGFFARLFSSSSSSPEASRQFRVKVQGSGEASAVSVQARDGQAVSNEIDRQTVSKMLALLHEQLKI